MHQDKVSFTRPENLHVTLKFLGEVDERRVKDLCDSLEKVSVTGQIDLAAHRIECFPHRGPVRIVAAELDGSLPALQAQHRAIEQRCKFLGFEKETRIYRPHVTLAHARGALKLPVRDTLIKASANLWPGPTFEVHDFVLMHSKLESYGAVYAVAARFPVK